MPFQSAVNCAEARVIASVNSRPVSIGFNCEFISGAYSQADIDVLAETIDAGFALHILPRLSSSCVYNRTDVRGLTSAVDLFGTDNTNQGIGGVAAVPCPNNVAWVIKHLTGFTGRAARGRSYLFGLPFSILDTDEDTIDQADADAFVDAFDTISALLDSEGWNHVVLHRYSAGAPLSTATIYTITSYAYTDLRVDTRRKRLGN